MGNQNLEPKNPYNLANHKAGEEGYPYRSANEVCIGCALHSLTDAKKGKKYDQDYHGQHAEQHVSPQEEADGKPSRGSS
jgi:hypothetical protein